MKKIFYTLIIGLVMISCSKEMIDTSYTIKGKVLIDTYLVSDEGVLLRESEIIPVPDIEVFVVTSRCFAFNCGFEGILEERDVTDAEGNYSITFERNDLFGHEVDIIVPENYTIRTKESRDINNRVFEVKIILKPDF